MTLNQRLKELEKKAKKWGAILKYKVGPKDKKLAEAIRKGKPDPKGKSRSGIIHPGNHIKEHLEEIRYHPQFPRELDLLCKDLIKEVTTAIPKWPSLEYGDRYKLPVIRHILSFLKAVQSPLEKNKQQIPKEPDEQPKDLITLLVAIEGYYVSRSTLLRAIKDSRLKSYRPGKTGNQIVSKAQVAGLWPKRHT